MKLFRLHILKLLISCIGIISAISLISIKVSKASDNAPKFKVGVIAPLTGILAEYGLAARNGITLARTQHPEHFNNTEFIYEDSQWDARTAVSAFNTLANSKKVSLVFNWGNPTSEALAPIAERLHLPLIGMTLDDKVARKSNYMIRSINPAAAFSRTLAEYLKTRSYKRIGIVIAENTYVQGLLNGLKDALGSETRLEVISEHNISDNDFRTSILRIREKQYDAIGVFLISGQVSSFYRQLRQQGLDLPSFGTDFFESSTEIRLAAGGMDGAVYPHLSVSRDFEKDYVQRFGNDYQLSYAGNAYDMAMLIGTLFNKARSDLTPDQIMSELKSPHTSLNGVSGDFSYRKGYQGDSFYEFPVHLKLIKGRGFECIS